MMYINCHGYTHLYGRNSDMNEKYRKDWKSLYERFDAWWKFENTDRPLMWITAPGNQDAERLDDPGPEPGADPVEDAKINPRRADVWTRNGAARTEFLAEAYPCASLNFGPGAMAMFLGCRPEFTPSTVWYNPLFEDPKELRSLVTRRDNEYFRKATEGYIALRALAKDDYLTVIPDIIDSMDTISAILGPENLLYAIMDNPEDILAGSGILDDIYFDYYDMFRDITVNDDGIMGVQAFQVIGPRVAKLQCDFCAMISPSMFDEFIAPSLRKYCSRLGHALYHIDGEGEMCHVDTMVGIDGLDAFQWIPQGATTGTSFTDPKFYPMFDRIHGAGKGLYLSINRGGPDDWADETERLVKRYGTRGMYFLYPGFPDVKTAERFIARFTK